MFSYQIVSFQPFLTSLIGGAMGASVLAIIKTPLPVILWALIFIPLVVSPPLMANPQGQEEVLEITWDGEYLSVDIKGVEVQRVFQRLEQSIGIELENRLVLPEHKISAKFDQLEMNQGIQELIRIAKVKNYILFYEEDPISGQSMITRITFISQASPSDRVASPPARRRPHQIKQPPAKVFTIYLANIIGNGDSFHVKGVLGAAIEGIDLLSHDVIVQIGNFTARIPAGAFVQLRHNRKLFHYRGSKGGITGMTINLREGTFQITASGVDMASTPPGSLLISISVGSFVGSEVIPMNQVKNRWFYRKG